MSAEPTFIDPAGVTIPLSTIVGGQQSGVLKHLEAGLGAAKERRARAVEHLDRARAEFDAARLGYERSEAGVSAWQIALDSARKAFRQQ